MVRRVSPVRLARSPMRIVSSCRASALTAKRAPPASLRELATETLAHRLERRPRRGQRQLDSDLRRHGAALATGRLEAGWIERRAGGRQDPRVRALVRGPEHRSGGLQLALGRTEQAGCFDRVPCRQCDCREAGETRRRFDRGSEIVPPGEGFRQEWPRSPWIAFLQREHPEVLEVTEA